MKLIKLIFFLFFVSIQAKATGPDDRLRKLQQSFVDLKFGMFIHFNLPGWLGADWIDPHADPALFNPGKMDCAQWARRQKVPKCGMVASPPSITAGFVYGIPKRRIIM